MKELVQKENNFLSVQSYQNLDVNVT